MKTLQNFVKDYPRKDLGEIGACYASCQGRSAKDPYEAYDHIEKCPWCKKWMIEQKKLESITRYSHEGREEAKRRYKIR